MQVSTAPQDLVITEVPKRRISRNTYQELQLIYLHASQKIYQESPHCETNIKANTKKILKYKELNRNQVKHGKRIRGTTDSISSTIQKLRLCIYCLAALMRGV